MKKSYCLLHVKSFTVPYFLAFGINTKISSVIRQSQKVNLKTEEARKQSIPNFPKNQRFLPPEHVRECIRGYEMFVFLKIWRALLSCYLRFEICSFALLPTKWVKGSCCTFTFEFKLVCFL